MNPFKYYHDLQRQKTGDFGLFCLNTDRLVTSTDGQTSLAQLVLMSSRQTCLHTCGFLAREVVLETARFIFESVLRVTYASGTVVFGVTGRPLSIRRCHLVLAGPVIF